MDLISSLRYAAQKEQSDHGEPAAGDAPAPTLHPDLIAAFSLAGRVAVVTGAAGGIGAQTAVTLAQAGATVVCADLHEGAVAETVDRVRAIGGTASVVGTDVSRKDDVDALAAHTLNTHGRLDVWANVAGILQHSLVVDATEGHLRDVLAVNLEGTYWGCAAAARAMIPAGRGSIINIASAGADMPSPRGSAYSISKAGVMMLTRTLAVEVGPHGVRANAVAPGWIDTPMTSYHYTNEDGSVDATRRTDAIAGIAAMSPLGSTGEPADIAWCILYLASDAARFVTGQVFRPNGGVVMP
jgi:3-oxoacyl-[acyl-carrier protein] reductase